ncbi:hypothetical protein Cylst_5851 [Cylindrospermum stagnale PCC 7417]|uniref:Uncharacterized protein n=1 Tax=Cylindrospermum stagnale PCC 7417 TaxID=56107 RepID=K9X592_9NOST|nr:hypothetical protein [Cylindrospermum stagnale]AFZ27835.1 hypothetical protein Cylst_5851 [Cylindrospermum stagnale PCC 7417]
MLDIKFYSQDKEESEIIEVSQELYEWLTQSEFSKIGKSELQEMKIDGEPERVPVVQLEGNNRRKFSNFFRDAIVQESDEMLNKLSGNSSKNDYQDAIYRLNILQQLRKLIENEQYKYFQRFSVIG